MTTAVKWVAVMPCTTENEKKEALQAGLEQNMSLFLHNSFFRNQKQKLKVDLLSCCKQILLEQESWSTARNSAGMLQKELEDRRDGRAGGRSDGVRIEGKTRSGSREKCKTQLS